MADWLTTWSVWHLFVLGFVLLIAEILVPGVFLLWWGLAAIVAAGVMALVPSLSLTALAVFYAILAIFSRCFGGNTNIAKIIRINLVQP